MTSMEVVPVQLPDLNELSRRSDRPMEGRQPENSSADAGAAAHEVSSRAAARSRDEARAEPARGWW